MEKGFFVGYAWWLCLKDRVVWLVVYVVCDEFGVYCFECSFVGWCVYECCSWWDFWADVGCMFGDDVVYERSFG